MEERLDEINKMVSDVKWEIKKRGGGEDALRQSLLRLIDEAAELELEIEYALMGNKE